MDLGPYVDQLKSQLLAAAESGGDEARALVDRLMAPLDAAVRLTLQDVLAAAAEDITCELAPGSVEVRLRGRDLQLVVTAPPAESSDGLPAGHGEGAEPADLAGPSERWAIEADEGGMSRINVRMPEQLKARVEHAAGRDGLSVNAWLVRAAAAAVERVDSTRRREPSRVAKGAQRYTGWAR